MTAKEVKIYLSERNLVLKCLSVISTDDVGAPFSPRMFYRAIDREEKGLQLTDRQNMMIRLCRKYIDSITAQTQPAA